MKSTPVSYLEELGACPDAIAFAQTHPDLETAWLACDRGDWLLWFAAKRKVDLKVIVRIACECARLTLPYTKDLRVLACIETAEKWTRGEATIKQVREARAAAYAAYAAAAADDAYAAAAAYAAYAAAADDAAAAAAAYAAARSTTLKQCADIVRKHIPELP